ncbi:MAG: Mannosylfructose-phosphate synthase [Microgenomates group bacterium ADurb.Bin219]|nr:MAG: Mannosylfructose-phosphate synthase [Microgenomates group bacterium ADurb.Bin219]HNP89564.1 glycosyltransferase family 1 protein [Candidatus Woesebacteria bacterium]
MIIGIDGNEANEKNRVGIGQFAFNVLSGLEKIDSKNNYFIYLKEPPLKDLPKERAGWQYKVVGPKKFWTQLGLPLKLFSQKEKLDIFYSPSHYAPRFSSMPTIISIMDLWHHRHPEQFDKKDLYQLLNWEKYSVKNSSRIVTISEFTKSEIVNFYNYPEERITVAYPGYTKLKIENEKLKIEEIKRKFGIKGNYLLYLGTLQPKKNLVGLIEAFNLLVTSNQWPVISNQSQITNRQSPIALVIAGKKGWLYEEIFRKVKELRLEERVIFTDFVADEEKPYLLAGAKCFVLPSFYEGFGIPVLEAMSLGVPVAVSNTSSLPEVAGKAGFYFSPEKPEEIADCLLKVLKLSSSELAAVSEEVKKQAEKFSWEKCTRKVLETIESV